MGRIVQATESELTGLMHFDLTASEAASGFVLKARKGGADQLRSSGRVKPKVRLCEPWVMVRLIRRAAKRQQKVGVPLITSNRCRRFGARCLWGG